MQQQQREMDVGDAFSSIAGEISLLDEDKQQLPASLVAALNNRHWARAIEDHARRSARGANVRLAKAALRFLASPTQQRFDEFKTQLGTHAGRDIELNGANREALKRVVAATVHEKWTALDDEMSVRFQS